MAWIISFVVSWVIFLLSVEYKKLKVNIVGGIIALILGTLIDWGGQKLELYTFKDLILSWFGCSAFYKFGPIFTMGILFVQYVPAKRIPQLLHILACSTLYLFQELLIISTGTAVYIHWHYMASYIVDLLTFSSLTWFTTAFLKAPRAGKRFV